MLSVQARTRTHLATLAVICVLALLRLLLHPADLSLFAVAIGYAVAAIGVDISTGYAGQPNFGQSAFMAIGTYAAAIIQIKFGLGFLPALVGGVVICGLTATVLGFAASRLEHLGFGIITFAFAFAVSALLSGDSLTRFTGGPNGLAVPSASILGFSVSEPGTLYVVGLVLLSLVAYLTHNYVRSRAGRATLTVKQDERVAAVLGVGIRAVKLRAFAISGALGGTGGIIIAEGSGYITPESFPPGLSVTVFGMAALGGVGTITGPILGALFFWLVPSYVPGLAAYQGVFVAVVFLAALILFPAGLVGSIAERFGRRRQRPVQAPGPGPTEPEPLTAPPASVEARPIALAADEVSVSFGGVDAVRKASLELRQGSCHGLVGPNGAGKTTMVNALSGLVTVGSGQITLEGMSIDSLPPQGRRRLGLARTFQNPALVGDLNALDNVKVGVYPLERWSAWLDLLGLGLAAARERRTSAAAESALDAVGFPTSRRGLRAAELSHGEQKVVDLARALAGSPRVLLLDEPTAGLTAREMDSFAATLARQRATSTITLLIVSHHMRFLSGLADRVTVMESGQVLAEGTLGELSERPDVVTAFLGEDDAAI